MDLVLLSSLLLVGGLLGFSGVFDGSNDSGDNTDTPDSPTDDPNEPQTSLDDALYGSAAADRLKADSGFEAGWGGDDTITATGDAAAWGNKGDDSLLISDQAKADGGEGNDRMAVTGSGAADGAAGDDTLIGADLAQLKGGSGNDLILNGGGVDAFGNAGNDEMVGNRLYGGADDDTLTGSDRLYGGKGDDDMIITSYTGEAGAQGSSSAGEGNDSIRVDDDADGQSDPVYGGSGEDTISFFTGSNISADDASWSGDNDILIAHRSELSGEGGTVLLGKGDDLLAIDPNLGGNYDFDTATGYRLTTVRDFDPAHDKLGVIVPQDELAQMEVTITPDIEGDFTDVIFHGLNGNPDQTWRLNGVTALSPSDIALYADDQSVLDGTSYGTLDSAGQPTSGDDTLTATSGDLAGGDGNDDLTLSGDGSAFGEAGNDSITGDNDRNDVTESASLYGGTGDDTVNTSGQDQGFGDAGNDVLTALGVQGIYGGDGNDMVYGGIDGTAHGDAGDDTIEGTVANYGGAGNDVINGVEDGYGGAGDDRIHISGSGGESGPQAGTGDGGAGNDTIISVDASYLLFNLQKPHQGGTGDDLIETFSTQSADAGDGNDIVILERAMFNQTDGGNVITLGDGNDVLALDPNADKDAYAYDDDYAIVTVADFDPSQDKLALIVPEGALSNLDVTITSDTTGGFTDVTLQTLNGDPAQTFRLTGVTSLTKADIALYTDHDAVTDGTSYGTLDSAGQPTNGDDTLTATSGDLAGGDGNDDLTLSGGGDVSGDGGDDKITLENDSRDSSVAHGGTGNDTITGSVIDQVYGDEGDDVVESGVSGTGYGGAGNDVVRGGIDGSAFGDAGDDTVYAYSEAYGGAGNDVVEGLEGGYGGDGDDRIHITGYPSEGGPTSGTADGGAGNDTIIGDDVSFPGYNNLNPYTGGQGDDLIETFSTQSADAGLGNDIVILERAANNFNDGDKPRSVITLGKGADVLALDPNAEKDAYAWDDDYETVTVTDFKPGEDKLALIVPEGSLANLDVTITPDTSGGFTDVTLHTLNGDPAQTFRLTGVTSLTPADIALYTDHAAVTDGTSYGTLADQSPQDNAGDDTLTATSGDLAGGDGNDNLTLSGGGTASGDAGDDSISVTNEPFEASSIYGGTGDDTLSPSVQDTTFGDDGNDVLNGGTAGESYGGQGNDQVYGGEFGIAHGDDGDDTIVGHWSNYGDAGNDVIEGLQGAYGGDGDDQIHLTGDRGFDAVLSGSADGGAGNDTIIADDIQDSTYNTANPHLGGTGDDLIATFSTQSADTGAGNDLLIIERAADNVYNSGIISTISLGLGNDMLALDPNAEQPAYALGDLYDTVTVSDFDPTEDTLAIIVPETSLTMLDVTITPDTAGGFTDVTLHSLNGDPAQTFRLTGVTSLDPADIALYADHAAVAARTPWQQGVKPGA